MSAARAEATNPKGSRTWEWDRRLSGERELLAREKNKAERLIRRSSVEAALWPWAEVVRTSLTFMMMKKKNRIEMAMKIIANVKREMQKPRLAESVRSDKRDQAAPVGNGLRVPRKSDGGSST
jgi:hypothetical protein